MGLYKNKSPLKRRSGTALIVVLAVLTLLSTSVLSFWRQASMLSDLAIEREKYYHSYAQTFRLLTSGYDWLKKNFAKVRKKPTKLSAPLGQSLHAQTHKGKILLQAALYKIIPGREARDDKKQLLCCLSCLVNRKGDDLVVECFTLGPLV